MKQFIIRACLLILRRLKYSQPLALPPSVAFYASEIRALIQSEAALDHGSGDLLGDSWLKFRRVATMFRRSHLDIPKHDIFKAIIVLYEEEYKPCSD